MHSLNCCHIFRCEVQWCRDAVRFIASHWSMKHILLENQLTPHFVWVNRWIYGRLCMQQITCWVRKGAVWFWCLPRKWSKRDMASSDMSRSIYLKAQLKFFFHNINRNSYIHTGMAWSFHLLISFISAF